MKTREIMQHLNTAGKLVFSSPKKAYLDGEKYDRLQGLSLFARAELAAQVAFGMKDFIPPGGIVLEVAAGTGILSMSLLELGYDVLALDLQPHLLERLERKAANFRHKLLTVSGDMNNSFPLEDEQIDGVTSLRANRYIKGAKFYQESYRVLKEGGTIVLPMFTIDSVIWWRHAGLNQRTSSPGVAEDLREAGFNQVQVHDSKDLMPSQSRVPCYYRPSAVIVAQK